MVHRCLLAIGSLLALGSVGRWFQCPGKMAQSGTYAARPHRQMSSLIARLFLASKAVSSSVLLDLLPLAVRLHLDPKHLVPLGRKAPKLDRGLHSRVRLTCWREW